MDLWKYLYTPTFFKGPFTDIAFQSQQEQIQQIQQRLVPFHDDLKCLIAVESDCKAANIEENDYTVFTVQDLEFELQLVRQVVAKKIAFLENQVCHLVTIHVDTDSGRLYPEICLT